MASMIAMFDDHSSEVNAGIVRDVMIANTEAGYWNGASPPLGCKVVVAEVLEEDPVEAAFVNRIFRLYVTGKPCSGNGRMGIKAVVTFLNINGIRWRGRLFTTSFAEDVLKNEAYVGTHYYNRKDSRTKKPRPRSEWVAQSVPAIVDQELFDAAQRLKIEQQPQKCAPRVVNGPYLIDRLGGVRNVRRGHGAQDWQEWPVSIPDVRTYCL